MPIADVDDRQQWVNVGRHAIYFSGNSQEYAMSSFIVGRTYFQLTYADTDQTMPGVDPRVFLGDVTLEDGTHAFVFQDSVSYVTYG